MRIKRLAKARKSLEFFARAFSFEPPFKFLVDVDFLLAVLKAGLPLRESLQNLISVKNSKIFITTCIRRELEALSVTPGPRQGEWKNVLGMADNKQNNIQYIACKHPKTLKCTSHECINWSIAPAKLTTELNQGKPSPDIIESKIQNTKKEKKSNPEHLICCVQHSDLRSVLRKVPAVPTVYLHSASIVFDDPSDASKEYAQRFKVAHHNKVSSKQNLSILSSLQRFAPEKNIVLDKALENGGIYIGTQQQPITKDQTIIDAGGKSTHDRSINDEGQVVIQTPHIGKKSRPKGANPLSNKKAQIKQMPTLSYKTQKKLAAATVLTQPAKKQRGNNNNQTAGRDGEKLVQLPQPTPPPPQRKQPQSPPFQQPNPNKRKSPPV